MDYELVFSDLNTRKGRNINGKDMDYSSIFSDLNSIRNSYSILQDRNAYRRMQDIIYF